MFLIGNFSGDYEHGYSIEFYELPAEVWTVGVVEMGLILSEISCYYVLCCVAQLQSPDNNYFITIQCYDTW